MRYRSKATLPRRGGLATLNPGFDNSLWMRSARPKGVLPAHAADEKTHLRIDR